MDLISFGPYAKTAVWNFCCMDLTIGQEEHKICYLIITVYLPNVRAVPADLQARGFSHSLSLQGLCEKSNDL